MRFCDNCIEEPAKKKITAEMARILHMDPASKVCPQCFDNLQRQVKALR